MPPLIIPQTFVCGKARWYFLFPCDRYCGECKVCIYDLLHPDRFLGKKKEKNYIWAQQVLSIYKEKLMFRKAFFPPYTCECSRSLFPEWVLGRETTVASKSMESLSFSGRRSHSSIFCPERNGARQMGELRRKEGGREEERRRKHFLALGLRDKQITAERRCQSFWAAAKLTCTMLCKS